MSYKFEWWHVVVLVIALLVITQLTGNHIQSVFNIGEAGEDGVYNNQCKVTYKMDWDGVKVGCAITKGGWGDTTPILTVKETLDPMRAAYIQYLDDNSIVLNSKCYVDISITHTTSDRPTLQKPYTEAEYGGTHLALPGTFQTSSNDLLLYQGEYTNYHPVYYYEDYKCVLDTPFVVKNVGSIERWIATTATLTPVNNACTLEAKQCSDGSYVSRVAPDCEFAACPNEINWFTDDSMIAGFANWMVLVGGLVILIIITRLIK
jgi:hypothetical protein